MKARTVRQALALAYGTHRWRGAKHPAEPLPAEIAEAHARWCSVKPGNTLCAQCEAEINEAADVCPVCGHDPLPF